jgi:hypothetical protein
MVHAMPETLTSPIEIFRAGTHTPMQGAAISFDAADLAAIAGGYDPDLHHAPIVVGHPTTDAPAYGWIDRLTVEGDRLVAHPEKLDPAFADLVRAGRYAKVSASFYRPDAANNPTPGRWHLRHVGFLGAQPPAVKGLKPVAFSDEVGTATFADWHLAGGLHTVSRMMRRMRDYFIGAVGPDRAEEILPDWDVQRLADMAVEAQPKDATDSLTAYSDPHSKEADMPADTEPARDLAARQADLDRKAAEITAREAAFAEREAAELRDRRAREIAEDRAFVESIVSAGRLPVGLKPVAEALFADEADGAVAFADGAETRKLTKREALRDLLGKLPKPVETREIAGGDATAIDFSDSLDIAGAISSHIATAAKDGRALSPAEALAELKGAAR